MSTQPVDRGDEAASKLAWSGVIQSVQPRIRLTRSFDQRSHSYLGYVLRVSGMLGEEQRAFLVGIGEGAHDKHQFCAGDEVSGVAQHVPDGREDTAEFYKVSKLVVRKHPRSDRTAGPPWLDVAPGLDIYRQRGHRRLSARTYEQKCSTCMWGCLMAVEMIIDHWNPRVRRYRQETFCYGPLSCPLYKSGPTRKVPGRHGMSWEEEDWVDEEEVSHRGPDE